MTPRLEFGEEEGDSGGQPRSSVSTLSRDEPELVTMPSRFEKTQKKGTIDVWWIYDDGGGPQYLYSNIYCPPHCDTFSIFTWSVCAYTCTYT